MSRSKVLQSFSIPSFLTRYSQQTHPFRHRVSAGVGVGIGPSLGPSLSKLSRVQPFSRQATDPTTRNGFDAHLYTSGRWLRNDKRQRQIRQINLDFGQLCQKAVDRSNGAKAIKHCEKREGSFNRVVIFTMDDDSRVAARLPFSIAGPAKLATACEVVTIQYLQTNTNIPIPKILDWSDDAANSIGSEYIIMDYAAGIQLQHKWPYMSSDQKVRCIDSMYRKLREMADINFPAYGSIYFSTTPKETSSTVPLEGGFCVGPHCGTRYWSRGDDHRYYQRTDPNQGPWTTIAAFSDGLIDAGISRIPPTDAQLPKQSSYHGSIQIHLDLLEQGRAVLHAMCADSRMHNAASPILFHPDLHKRNIFVSDDDPRSSRALLIGSPPASSRRSGMQMKSQTLLLIQHPLSR